MAGWPVKHSKRKTILFCNIVNAIKTKTLANNFIYFFPQLCVFKINNSQSAAIERNFDKQKNNSFENALTCNRKKKQLSDIIMLLQVI